MQKFDQTTRTKGLVFTLSLLVFSCGIPKQEQGDRSSLTVQPGERNSSEASTASLTAVDSSAKSQIWTVKNPEAKLSYVTNSAEDKANFMKNGGYSVDATEDNFCTFNSNIVGEAADPNRVKINRLYKTNKYGPHIYTTSSAAETDGFGIAKTGFSLDQASLGYINYFQMCGDVPIYLWESIGPTKDYLLTRQSSELGTFYKSKGIFGYTQRCNNFPERVCGGTISFSDMGTFKPSANWIATGNSQSGSASARYVKLSTNALLSASATYPLKVTTNTNYKLVVTFTPLAGTTYCKTPSYSFKEAGQAAATNLKVWSTSTSSSNGEVSQTLTPSNATTLTNFKFKTKTPVVTVTGKTCKVGETLYTDALRANY